MAGFVRDIHPYGIFVDVGANRKGLLHISKIAEHYDRYIAKEAGFQKLGLKPGTPIDVEVVTNDKKRLELGFPSAVIESDESDKTATSTSEAKAAASSFDISEEEAAAWAAYGNDADNQYDNVDDEEAAMWAAYADYQPNQDEEDDEPDEDREIEDALGIGSW